MFLAPDGAPLALAEVKKRGQDLCWSILRGLWQA